MVAVYKVTVHVRRTLAQGILFSCTRSRAYERDRLRSVSISSRTRS